MKKILLSFLVFLAAAASIQSGPKKTVRSVSPDELEEFRAAVSARLCTRANTVNPLKVDAVKYYKDNTVEIYFSPALGEQPLRRSDIDWLYVTARTMLAAKFPQCTFRIFTDRKKVETLSSPWFSTGAYSKDAWYSAEGDRVLKGYAKDYERARKKKTLTDGSFVVRTSSSGADTVQVGYNGRSSGMASASTASGNGRQWVKPLTDRNGQVTKGLQDRNIALWDSHGGYYNNAAGRWSWQRPHLFQTCEDLLSASLVLQWLVPMLENAGACVILPRERDTNTDEHIVDWGSGGYSEWGNKWTDAPFPGFGAVRGTWTEGENPFASGSARIIKVSDAGGSSGDASAVWEASSLPGEYAVYVSYQSLPKSTTAVYTVRHCGQSSRFRVNQRMGGSTWVYLGTFFFDGAEDAGGRTPRNGVVLTNARVSGVEYRGDEVITADAVKFGGGMGNIARGSDESVSAVSGLPRYLEGARYWMQWAGFPQNLYSPLDRTSDYKDDYTCRAVWVNALSGGSSKNPYRSGYGVPIDLSLALHTDAGFSPDDSIVGTLAIYTSHSNNRSYLADGRDRMINRELCDIVQTQVVQDVRSAVDSSWNRRGMWDKSYLESRAPEVPSMLLELLSHQNFADASLAAEPEFRFTVCRAIYKGMLKFFKATEGKDYVVQPLPVTSFAAVTDGDAVRLSWKGRTDPLEPTASADGYYIYRRVISLSDMDASALRSPGRHSGFERIGYTKNTSYVPSERLEPGKIYSYMVRAVNRGGCSFPGEILSVGVASGERALIVNAFDRLGGGDRYDLNDTLQGGFTPWTDRGVPYGYDIAYSGDQYSFDRHDPYIDDARPGFGASWDDYDMCLACGNTFDYPLIHGAGLLRAGYGFSSCSRSAVEDMDPGAFSLVDVIYGKQRGRGGDCGVLDSGMAEVLGSYLERGGHLLLSGAYILSDAVSRGDSVSVRFAEKYLKAAPAGRSSRHTVSPCSGRNQRFLPSGEPLRQFTFSDEPCGDIYPVEGADVLTPLDRNASVALRYAGHGPGACVVYRGHDWRCAVCGFPIEVADDASALLEYLVETMKR